MSQLSSTQQEKADLVLKLLARAEDEAASENERAVARKKAQKIMERHSLTRERLKRAEYELVEWHLPEYSQAPKWYRAIMTGLKDFLGVFSLYYPGSRFKGDKNARLRISGREKDIEMFKYLLVSIKQQIHSLCREWKHSLSDSPSRKETYAFRSACAQRVRRRLKSLVDSVTSGQEENQGASSGEAAKQGALTLREETERKKARAKELMREAGHTWTSGSAASWKRGRGSRAGRKAGDRVSVNKPAGSGSTRRLSGETS